MNDEIDADICIVGGGFTGLWAAYHSALAHPDSSIVILEKEHVGFGASGRNAGWLSPLVPGNRSIFGKSTTRGAAIAMQRRMIGAVDEVLDIISENGLDVGARRSGNIVVARNSAAMQRLRDRRDNDLAWGYQESDVEVLDREELAERVRVDEAVGGLFYPTAARVSPGRLVSELARLCEEMGVTIYEGSEVTSIGSGRATIPRGRVNSPVIFRATEGYSGSLDAGSRRIIPINSSIIITEPLPQAVWDSIGWEEYELLSDSAHVFSYLQKTDDGRILIGGRGNPYRYASGIRADGTTDEGSIDALREKLHDLFPVAEEVPIAHAWSGVLGVTRDWCATVEFDQSAGIGSSQGYAGHGLTSSYLAAKSLVELAAGRTQGDAALPWVNHKARRWEREPVRWIGVHAMYRLFAAADRHEERTHASTTSWLARLGGKIAGLSE